MKQYKYILEPYKGPASRYRCPGCNQPRQFTRYVDAETLEPVADAVGICNRSNRCGYHYTPKQFFADNPTAGNWQPKQYKRVHYQPATMPPVDFIPSEWIVRSCKNYDHNNLYQAFCRWIGADAANYVFNRYRVGSSNHWPGATAFWQIDREGRAGQCKVMLYDAETGKRVKDGSDKVYFAGKTILNNYAANLQQCFFGEHLLKDAPGLPVAIVESEKTALYCSMQFPRLIWLATGGKQGCRWTEKEVCKVLEGRTIVLFPDLKATELWKQKAQTIAGKIKCRIHVSEDLEAMATDAEKEQGLDLMDYLLAKDTRLNGPVFATKKKELPPVQTAAISNPKPPPPRNSLEIAHFSPDSWRVDTCQNKWVDQNKVIPGTNKPITDWGKEITELETFFQTASIPDGPIWLNVCSTITDPAKFIDSHLATIKINNGKRTFLPVLNRLKELKQVLTKNII